MNYILINNQYTIQRYMYAHNFYSHRFGYSVFVTRFVVVVYIMQNVTSLNLTMSNFMAVL